MIVNTKSHTAWQVYRLTDDGYVQSLGYYVNEADAFKAFEYHSERLHFAYVDIRKTYNFRQ